MKQPLLPRALVLLALLCFSSACALPGNSLARVSVSGQLVSSQGQPLPGRRIELYLPKDYAVTNVDAEYEPNLFDERKLQRALIKTDELGTFAHSFEAVSYSSPFYVLPPIGRSPSKPPVPRFFVRVLDGSKQYYSVQLSEQELTYGVYPIAAGASVSEPPAVEPLMFLEGVLHPQERGEREQGWIANIRMTYLPQRVRRARPGKGK